MHQPLRVGIVGTGFAAKLRSQAFRDDERSQLFAIAGHTVEKTQELAQSLDTQAVESWQNLVKHPEIDLICICTINRDHGEITRAALNHNKHVIVEYPLSLDATEAAELIDLAAARGKLLHVEHIELLGGVHQSLKQHLSQIGTPVYLRYSTINPQNPAPQRWTYHQELFGFPFAAALSRLHRLTDAFGSIKSVNCRERYWGELPRFTACLCVGQFHLNSGAIAEVAYGKGEVFSSSVRLFEVYGDRGTLIFDGDTGTLVQGETTTPIEVGGRRGLFVQDTQRVLDYLSEGTPLYVTPQASLYSLKVANAAQKSAQMGQTITVV
ncbi:MAG: Gfo/Idh/MocA family oxidoreductase [Desertifilum sp. SIO1I2]|nr:Gfo/Idh/MocA family oxidoreductase [Desertifilum sp. SIO1I2]